MSIKPYIATISLLSILSFSAFSATSINSEQAKNRQRIETISISQVGATPIDMHQLLDKKAQERGASAWHVIEARTGDNWHVTAELYK